MPYPPVVIVDECDKVVGAAPLREAWDKGLIHRTVFVIVENAEGKVLLHRRAPGMVLFPGRWDTAGGHVDVTPNCLESAKLELHEEVGINGLGLAQLDRVYTEEPYDNGVRAKRFVTIFRCRTDEPGQLGEDEAVEVRWFTKQEITLLAMEHPELVAEGLRRCLPYILKDRK
jgi:8-oxo-dGTP pyrophosphatase MutT (NUDIX family)